MMSFPRRAGRSVIWTLAAIGLAACAAWSAGADADRPDRPAVLGPPNEAGTYWTNLLGAWSRKHVQWHAADTPGQVFRVLSTESGFAAQHGFGSWGLFEFGKRTVRHEESGWDRPIHQFSDLDEHQKLGLKRAIAEAKGRGLEVYGYVGTLDRSGEDVPPAAIPLYLDELTLMAEAGFDRIYFDATAWNSPLSNAERPKGVGGGQRRQGIMEIREALARRGLDLEVGVEAWPNDDGVIVQEAGPALITGQFAITRWRQGSLDYDSAAGDVRFHVALFNMHQDAKDPRVLREIARRGYAFDAGGSNGELIRFVTELNAIAQRARRASH